MADRVEAQKSCNTTHRQNTQNYKIMKTYMKVSPFLLLRFNTRHFFTFLLSY